MMTPSSASETLKMFWDGYLPIDPFEFVKKLEVKLTETTDPNKSGFFLANPPEIIYNITESYERQRFTVAHELGHLILGHGDSPRFVSGCANRWGINEQQANQFAADLLMPKRAIDYLFNKKNIITIEGLADAMKVSKEAMYYRLVNIGILSYR